MHSQDWPCLLFRRGGRREALDTDLGGNCTCQQSIRMSQRVSFTQGHLRQVELLFISGWNRMEPCASFEDIFNNFGMSPTSPVHSGQSHIT